MMIVSFAWTSDAFIAGRKSKTRREWSDQYASHFKVGDCCKAYDKQPRFGGQPIGMLQVRSLTYEDIATMPDLDYELEGFAYMEEQGIKFRDKDPWQAFNEWRNAGGFYWVLGFKKLTIL